MYCCHTCPTDKQISEDLWHKDKEPTHHRPNHLPLPSGSRTSRQICPHHSSPSRHSAPVASPHILGQGFACDRTASCLRRSARRERWPQCQPPTRRSVAADRFHAGDMLMTSLGWHPMGATLNRSALNPSKPYTLHITLFQQPYFPPKKELTRLEKRASYSAPK